MVRGAVRTERLASLIQVGRLAQTQINLETLRVKILSVVAETMQADRATLYFYDAPRKLLWSKVFTKSEVPEIKVRLGQGVAGHVAETGKILNVKNVKENPHFDDRYDLKTGYRTCSLLAVPMTMKNGERLGVLQVLNKTGDGGFTEEDENILALLATQVAAIVENSSLSKQAPTTRRERRTSRIQLKPTSRFNHIIGHGSAMSAVYDRIEQVAKTDVTVLVQGESGTGKEVVSRAIHYNSSRQNRALIKVDCAALPESLIENELFGHEKGAFTGASKRYKGKLEQAGHGTLFIDEIGELPLGVQGKLLRVLQDREFEALGSEETKTVNARIIAATNRNLSEMVAQGKFREDLFYRIRVAVIELPPLRLRGEPDLRALAQHFADRAAKRHKKTIKPLSDSVLRTILKHSWPGNVRELEHCLESAVVFCDEGNIRPEHLAIPVASMQIAVEKASESEETQYVKPIADIWGNAQKSESTEDLFDELVANEATLEDVEKLFIERVLKVSDGNKSEAARRLGIGRNTLGRKLKRYSLE